jgi:asparagine synthase (glutamine-hydrolysing)
MCGIAGVINFDGMPVPPPVLKNMTDAIAHRGPDGEGQWVEGPVGIGHRRLAILDLSSAGHQPMISASKRYVLSYNGEVYNFKELRVDLESKGYQFHSNTDTEVVLNAWDCWGLDALNKFNGMFAFAVWDRQEKALTLARDRYGIKPLYYTNTVGTVLFGSEIKAFLPHPQFNVSMDFAALREYFTFQNFLERRTLFSGVELLPAGCYLTIKQSHPSLHPVEYWNYDFSEPEKELSKDEYIEELDRLMIQAVHRQLVSDVGVSSYLSGGMDSGVLTALASAQLPYINTFTVGFDMSSASGIELAFDERVNAEHMSYVFKTEHYEMVLKAGDMERCMPDLVWHLEEPRVGQSYPNYYAAKLASKFGKVVLAGTGGDELFGGYPWRYYRAVVNDDFENYIDKYYVFWQRLVDNSTQQKLFEPIWDKVKDVWTRDIMAGVFKHHARDLTRPEDYVNHSLYFEAKTFLQGLFVVEDKLSMAHSLESRVPFMDNDLVDFAMKLPVKYKLGNLQKVVSVDENELSKFLQRTNDGKLLLREAMQRHLPKEVISREKQGFSAPDASWFKGESIDYVINNLLNHNAKIYDYLDPVCTQRLLKEHLSGKINRRLLIWSLLNVEEWCRQFL